MSPYLSAHAAYHRDGEPWIPWVEALDFHLQHGVVVSDGNAFLMARRVLSSWPDHQHLSLCTVAEDEVADGWHVWSAAGGLEALLEIARRHPAAEITFQRRDERLHRARAGRLLKGTGGAWEVPFPNW